MHLGGERLGGILLQICSRSWQSFLTRSVHTSDTWDTRLHGEFWVGPTLSWSLLFMRLPSSTDLSTLHVGQPACALVVGLVSICVGTSPEQHWKWASPVLLVPTEGTR